MQEPGRPDFLEQKTFASERAWGQKVQFFFDGPMWRLDDPDRPVIG